nr:hypothetical protein [Tanacetum cinerariifolium]
MRNDHRDNQASHIYKKNDTPMSDHMEANYLKRYHDQNSKISYSYQNRHYPQSRPPNRMPHPSQFFERPKASMEEMMKKWMASQAEANERMKNQVVKLEHQINQGLRNRQAIIENLDRQFEYPEKIPQTKSLPHITNTKKRHEFIYKPPSIQSENDKGDVKFIKEDEIKPIPIMPNPKPINSNSQTVSHFLKDYTKHTPYTNAKKFANDALLNNVGDKELKSFDSVGTRRITKKEKNENGGNEKAKISRSRYTYRGPYIEEQILDMVMKGKRGGHIPRRGKQVVGRGKTLTFGSQPRGTYFELEIDYMLVERDQALVAAKSEPKTEKQELGLLRSSLLYEMVLSLLSQMPPTSTPPTIEESLAKLGDSIDKLELVMKHLVVKRLAASTTNLVSTTSHTTIPKKEPNDSTFDTNIDITETTTECVGPMLASGKPLVVDHPDKSSPTSITLWRQGSRSWLTIRTRLPRHPLPDGLSSGKSFHGDESPAKTLKFRWGITRLL